MRLNLPHCTPGPACVPSYTIKDVWPPDYDEEMMRNFTIPRNAVIEIEEPERDRESPEDDISASVVTVKEANTCSSTETQTEDIPEVLEESLLVTSVADVIDEETVVTDLRSRRNSVIPGQFLKPPKIANSLECLQQLSERRRSLIELRHKTF